MGPEEDATRNAEEGVRWRVEKGGTIGEAAEGVSDTDDGPVVARYLTKTRE